MADNGNGNGSGNGSVDFHIGTPSVIELELTDEMRDAKLVTMVSCNYGSRSITFGLNHRYENKIIECYNIECGKWTNTLDRIVNTLEANGMSGTDCTIV